MVSRDVKWTIRSSVDSDIEKVSNLRKSFSNSEGSNRRSVESDYYRWKISGNPIANGILNVSDDAGIICGMTSLTPKKFLYRQIEYNGAEIGDTFTHPEYQRQGMFSKLVNTTRDQGNFSGFSFIYGTPNSQSLPGYEKLNFAQIRRANVFSWVRPTNMVALVEKYTKSRLLATLVAPLIKLWFAVRYRADKPTLELTVRRSDTFPNDIGSLSEKCQKNYEFMLKRDKQYLDWRFIINPDKYIIWICESGGRTVGYLVAKIGTFGGLRVGYFADFLVDEQVPKVFSALCGNALKNFVENKVDMLTAWSVEGSHYQQILSQFGFLKFRPVPVICNDDNIGSDLVLSTVNWHFTMADSDNI
jgi:GNAT superfamily N-acetyltransferase